MGLLAMLLTFAAAFIAVISVLASVVSGRTRFVKFIVAAAACWVVVYAAALFGTSLSSTERVLPLGEAKAFCGFYLDCHLHVSVTGARTVDKIGDDKAEGAFLVVGLRFFSDARRAKLSFHDVSLVLTGPDGSRYERDPAVERGLGDIGRRPFYIPLPPEGAFEREVVFDVPKDFTVGKMSVTEGVFVDRILEAVLIGDEDSLLHAKTYFEIRPR